MKTNDELDNFLSTIPAKVSSGAEPEKKQSTSRLRYGPDGCVLPSKEFLELQKLRKGLSEEKAATFEEWKSTGYWIKKGAKSVFRSPLNEPMFTIEQVYKAR